MINSALEAAEGTAGSVEFLFSSARFGLAAAMSLVGLPFAAAPPERRLAALPRLELQKRPLDSSAHGPTGPSWLGRASSGSQLPELPRAKHDNTE